MASRSKFRPSQGTDYSVTDPFFLDPHFPPEQFTCHFKSAGVTVHGTLWTADGPSNKPCLVLSPQIFGGDRLESLVVPLVSSGISVFTFHPRGMWDGGEFSFVTALDDLLAAASFVRNSGANGCITQAGNPFRIDPERVVVAGLSGGGGSLSIAACAQDPLICGVAAIAPGNFELNRDPRSLDGAKAFFQHLMTLSDGRINLTKWLSSLTASDFDRISPIVQAAGLAGKKVLLVGADRDIVTPISDCHRPIAAAIAAVETASFTEVILESDHSFLTKRIALSRLLISWLQEECGF